jgi:hypothetical protein
MTPDKHPPRKPGDKPPPPPIVAYEDVTASCGHIEKFGLFADRLDKFRKDRRKKVTDRPCKACREQKQRQEQEAAKARKEEKRQLAEQSGEGTRSSKKQEFGKQERLPDGAKFEVVYDSGKTQWSGTLTVGGKVFSGSAGALFTLLNRLDRQFRLTLAESPREADPHP